MSDLGANKIFGAVLATGLVILGLQQVSGILFHTEAPEKPGYAVEVQEEAAGGPAAPEVPPDWGTVLPTANVAAGETVFGKCLSCHTIAPGGAVMTGPNLNGVVGRHPATFAGFDYSAGMKAYGEEHPVWDYQTLYHYLQAPQQVVKGTKMTFVGIKKQDELVNLIAYLRSQSPNAPPIPPPNPAAAAPAEGETATAAPAGAAAPAPPAGGAPAPAAAGAATDAAAPAAAAPAAP